MIIKIIIHRPCDAEWHKYPSPKLASLWKWFIHINYINPGSQIPQVEARKRRSRDLFTSSGRATALIDRHFGYTFLQQSMTRLTNTAILLTYTSRFHWRFSGNWQEHICERNIRCFGSPSHLSLGSDRLNVTVSPAVSRNCTVPRWDVQRLGLDARGLAEESSDCVGALLRGRSCVAATRAHASIRQVSLQSKFLPSFREWYSPPNPECASIGRNLGWRNYIQTWVTMLRKVGWGGTCNE